ncbi:deoxyribodipyrimidine photo-lyase/cryptochrome family protein [Brevibacillus fortis]|nr:deoxyribodipyrimidine photo-lyase/cryptochrome family protein [Brevibacillus fortis]
MIAAIIYSYKEKRDMPGMNATSRLSFARWYEGETGYPIVND